ncbi:NUDIX domain-containing protein [Gordonia hankookensis]|uniref:NUDIX domain-containing protein n=1 Tax=Gordonia hankookensis TaxID=589403 RepID=A0ABR7WBR6_9ACTN|nr:NUDIX domain-containing protein [Gordonia hankookensis]
MGGPDGTARCRLGVSRSNISGVPGPSTIVVSGVVVRDVRGFLLTVRKRGTRRFMLPGGKPEQGESAAAAAVRECAEEVGLGVDMSRLRQWGRFRSAAANEAGWDVVATIFEAEVIDQEITPTAEIDEIRWMDIDAEIVADDLAPLLVEHVIPALRRAGHDS